MNNKDFYKETFSKLRTSAEFESKLNSKINAEYGLKTEKGNVITMTSKKMRIRTIAIAAAVAALLAFSAAAITTVLLSAREAASEVGLEGVFDSDCTEFENSSAVLGDYTATLLGITEGENLRRLSEDGELLDEKRCYMVVAVAKNDGSPIEEYGEYGFNFSPLVEGYAPWEVNAWTLSGGYHSFIKDGVQYLVYDFDSFDEYEGHKIYIAAYDGFVPTSDIFSFSEDGKIDFAEDYTGIKWLAELPEA